LPIHTWRWPVSCLAHAQRERKAAPRAAGDEIDAAAEMALQRGEKSGLVELHELSGFLGRHGQYQRVVLRQRQEGERAVGREALPGATSVRGAGMDFGDDGVLMVIVHPDAVVVAGVALGMDDETGGEVLRLAAAGERQIDVFAAGGKRDDRTVKAVAKRRGVGRGWPRDRRNASRSRAPECRSPRRRSACGRNPRAARRESS
jgi:hypothetical protein